MYIIAIAWLYVVFMMSITEESVVAAILTFFLYGIFPLTIVLYLIGTPQRKRNRAAKVRKQISTSAQSAAIPDAAKTNPSKEET